MVELTRRWFLGGAISLVAAAALPLTVERARASNLPRIFGNGRDYDGEGFSALLRGEPVVLPGDAVELHGIKQAIVHRGTYLIEKEIRLSFADDLKIEQAVFDGTPLRNSYDAIFSMTRFDAMHWIDQPGVRLRRTGEPLAVKSTGHAIGEVWFNTSKTAYWQGDRTYPKETEI